MRLRKSGGFVNFILIVAGLWLAGEAAVWGARAAGLNPKAAWPFPSFEAIALFGAGTVFGPLLALILNVAVRAAVPKVRIPTAYVVLVVAPLLTFALGNAFHRFSVRHYAKEGKQMAARVADYELEYSKFAAQAIADPEIVLREKWFTWDPQPNVRYQVFENSMRNDKTTIAYTTEQLQRLDRMDPQLRRLLVRHPACPPEIIESMWPIALRESKEHDVGLLVAILYNPQTPQHLIEPYETEKRKTRGNSWDAMDEALKQRSEPASPPVR
jgi:hypothetical protein